MSCTLCPRPVAASRHCKISRSTPRLRRVSKILHGTSRLAARTTNALCAVSVKEAGLREILSDSVHYFSEENCRLMQPVDIGSVERRALAPVLRAHSLDA